MAETQTQNRILTIPNVLSISRLMILLPVALYLLISGRYVSTIVALFFLGATDWLDGFLARSLHQQSNFGKILDVVADRISVVIVGIGLVIAGLMPWWVVAYIAAIDAVVAALTWYLYQGPPPIPVSMSGKVRTALLLLALPGLILAAALESPVVRNVALALLLLGMIFQAIAAVGYIAAMLRDKKKAND